MGKCSSVLIMAGGTGGHIFPGLAVAKKMQEAGMAVHWLGTRKGLEKNLLPAAGIAMEYISISGVRGKGWKDLLLAPARLTIAMVQALKIIHRLKPDIILGMGGFVSAPGGIAALLLGYPLVIHEQNAKPGTTNKFLAYFAKKVLEGFPGTFVNRNNVVTVGNPVREEIFNAASFRQERYPQPLARSQEPLHLLVLGGSLGAVAINELVPQAIAKMPAVARPLVYHQTGEKHQDRARTTYSKRGVTAKIEPFIVDMDKAYAWADIVLCRAGALTVAELCAAGIGAILVPFPYAIDDHQTANANYMAKQDAALVIQQKDLTVEKLIELLQIFNQLPEKYIEMGRRAYQLRPMAAVENVLRICQEICH